MGIQTIKKDQGFALLPIIGILAIMTIMATMIGPNLVTLLHFQSAGQEDHQLDAIGQGTARYLRVNRAWPANLAALSPDYTPLDSTNISVNSGGFPRYYAVHPTTSSFSNGTGLTTSQMTDVRFLLISNLSADAAPTITNATEFQTWWTTDETVTPDLHITRGNMAHLFHQVQLTAQGDGGSFDIDGTSTNSGGSTLTPYTNFHAVGTVVGLDEADTYATPELQFVLTKDVSYTYVPCLPAGQKWTSPPIPSCPTTRSVLWMSTLGSASGTPGASEWTSMEVVVFGEPDLTYESGPTSTTSGSFSWRFNLGNFTTGDENVDGIHYVRSGITILDVSLTAGDLLLSTTSTSNLVSTNSITVRDEDVFIFHPDIPGDYSEGTFTLLIDGSDLSIGDIEAITLVEANTVVGGTSLQAGDFLYADTSENVIRFVPTSLGSSTSGSQSDFIKGSDINIDVDISGLDLAETSHTIGDVTLQGGQVLMTLEGNDSSVGDNSISARDEDIFVLDLTETGSSTEGNATLVFDGTDVSLDSSEEDINGLSLGPASLPARVTSAIQVLYTFEEGDGSTVADVSGVGSPLDLTIQTPANTSWVTGALSIDSSTIVESAGAATKIINAAQTTNEITVEAWVIPANTTQEGPSRIATLSLDTGLRNFTLAQDEDEYDQRLRTTSTSNNGMPGIASGSETLTTTLTHVAYTRNLSGAAKFYINGIEVENETVAGNFSNWASDYKFGLANEFTMNRAWLGELHLVAVYNSAISEGDVRQNYASGANPTTD